MKIKVKDLALEDWGCITYNLIYLENVVKCSITMGQIQIGEIENKSIPEKVYDLGYKFGYMIQRKLTKLIKEQLSIYEETDIGCNDIKKSKPKNTSNFIFSVSDEVNWIVNNNPLQMLQLSVNT
jgi:hypothetical protein